MRARLEHLEVAELLRVPVELALGVQKRVRALVALECVEEHGGQQGPQVHATVRGAPFGQRVQRIAHMRPIEEVAQPAGAANLADGLLAAGRLPLQAQQRVDDGHGQQEGVDGEHFGEGLTEDVREEV